MDEENTSVKVLPNKVYKDIVKIWCYYYREPAQKFPKLILPIASLHSAKLASVLSQDPCASTHQSCSQIPSVYLDQRAK